MPSSRHSPLRSFVRSREFGVLAILLLFVVGLEVTSRVRYAALPLAEQTRPDGGAFWTSYNVSRIAQMYAYMAIATIGAAIVLIAGGVDLSSGSVFGLGAVATMFAVHAPGEPGQETVRGLGWGPGAAIALACAAGLGVGLLNGALVAKGRITPFIVTLGMLSVAKGLQMWVCGGINVALEGEEEPALYGFLRTGALAGGKAAVPGVAWAFLVLLVLCAVLLAKFKWGRSVYAVGGNEEVARHSGIPVDRVKIGVYAAAGALAALAGAAGAVCLGSAGAATGNGYELQFIAGVVVGGTSLAGGRGSVVGAALGAGVLRLLTELLLLYNVQDYLQYVAYGGVIVIVAAFDEWRARGGWRVVWRWFRRPGSPSDRTG